MTYIKLILEGASGFNLLNNNVNAMSLAQTHLKCRPHSLKLGINTDLQPAAAIHIEPQFLRIWSAFSDASSLDLWHSSNDHI